LPKFIEEIKKKIGLGEDPFEAAMMCAIEVVVDSASPKIRLIHGYKKKLRQPVESALNHIDKLIEMIPGPVDLTDDSRTGDMFARAFFSSREELKTTVANDPDLQEFLAQKKEEQFYVLLAMDRHVKTVFGSKLQGEVLQRDVAMRSVGFSDHKFRAPSVTMDDAIRTIELGALEILGHQELEIMLEEQARKEELKQMKDELTAKIKMMAADRKQMVLEWDDESGRKTYRESQTLLDTIEEELRSIRTETLDLNYYLNHVEHVLNHAAEYLSAKTVIMHFDRMGILIEGEPDDVKDAISVADFKLGLDERRSALFLKLNRSDLLAL
jgi:hypothetical protein